MTEIHFPAGTFTPNPHPAAVPRMLAAQFALELKLLVRNGEQLLLTMFIPITLLVGLTLLPLGSFGDNRAATFVPVIMALALISTAFTGQAIAVAFDRRYGALKRLGATALPVWGIIAGKSAAEIAADEPRLRAQITSAQDKTYGGPVNVTTRLLTLLSAEGLIVRGRPRGGWTSSQFTWFAAAGQAQPPAAAARTELARRWLAAFGPATVSDLQWWTGLTAGQVKQALAGLDVTEVDLHGSPGLFAHPFLVVWMGSLGRGFVARQAVTRIKPQNSISLV